MTSGDVCVALKDLLVSYVRKNHPDVDVIVGLEARGFLFSLLLAAEIGVACVPIRKKGKLPGECYSYSYVLEYGTVCPWIFNKSVLYKEIIYMFEFFWQDTVEIQKSSIKAGQKVIVIDDLLATGGNLSQTICKIIFTIFFLFNPRL